MLEALHYDFIQHAIAAGVIVSIAAGIIGTLVVVNRMIFLAGGVAHAAYGGVGLAIYFGLPALLTTGVFSVFVALLLAFITLNQKHRTDSMVGLIWAFGMAMGIILVDLTPGYNSNFMSYLFGSILAVSSDDIVGMGVLLFTVIAVVVVYYRQILAISYDSEFAGLKGIHTKFFYALMLVMTALVVVMAIQIVGLIMVIALLSIPTYIAEKFSNSLAKMMFFSALLSFVFTMGGLLLSYAYDLTSGASIIMVASFSLAVFMLLQRFVSAPRK